MQAEALVQVTSSWSLFIQLAVIDIVMNREVLEVVCKWWRGCWESVMTTDTELKRHVTGGLATSLSQIFPQSSVHCSGSIVGL